MKKFYLALFLSLLGTNFIFAEKAWVNSIYYEFYAATQTATVLTPYASSYTGSIEIPETVTYNNRTYTVTAIIESAFHDQSITSIKLPSTLKSIGESSFAGCSKLTSIVIPGGVNRIEAQTFANCTSLADVTLEEGITYIGEMAFAKCTSLNSITIPSTITSMGDYAFAFCQYLKTVYWNAIRCADFKNNWVSPFNTCDYHTSENYAMYVYIQNTKTMLHYGSNHWTNSIIFGDEVERIPACLCENWKELNSVIIPDLVKEIGNSAFSNSSINHVTLGVSLNTIGAGSFSGTLISKLSIPDNVNTIYSNAFGYCKSLTTITLGSGLSYIASKAFFAYYEEDNYGAIYYPSITDISIYATTPPTIANDAFFGYDNLKTINLNVRSTALTAYQSADVWKDMYIQALENDLRTFTLNVSSSDETKGATTAGGAYEEDTEVLIYASAKEGYQFSQWSDGNTDNPRAVTMTGDLTYIAQFVAATPIYTLTISANAIQGTTLGSDSYESGSTTSIAAIANSGYTFSQWSDGSTDNPRTLTVTGDIVLTAIFTADAAKYTITATATNATQGSAVGTGAYEVGSTATIAAVPNVGYHFSQWNDGIQTNPRTVQVTSNATYLANFEADAPKYTLTVMSTNSSQGTTYGEGSYEGGATALLLAVAADGFHFTQWNDGNTDNPRLVTITANTTYFANFEQDAPDPVTYTLDVTSENVAQGWTTEGCEYKGGEQVMIYAQPASGYQFSQWSDGNTENPRFLTITNDMTLTAQFELETTTNINNVATNANPVHKIINEGKVFIIRGDKTYTIQGQEVK